LSPIRYLKGKPVLSYNDDECCTFVFLCNWAEVFLTSGQTSADAGGRVALSYTLSDLIEYL